MARRPHNDIDLYLGDDLLVANAQAIYDNRRMTVEVKEKVDGRWTVTHTYAVASFSQRKIGREQFYTWNLSDGSVLTGTKQGCGCGGKR